MKTKTKWLCGITIALLFACGITAYAVGGRVLVDFLQFSGNAAPAASPSGKSVWYFDSTAKVTKLSEDAGGYAFASPNASGSSNALFGNIAATVSGTSNTLIGATGGTLTSGSSNTLIGASADVKTATTASAIALGIGAIANTNEFAASAPNWYVGNHFGNVSQNAAAGTINGQSANGGTNKTGGPLTIGGGAGTGTANGGNVTVQTSPSLLTGTTAQTLTDRYIIVSKGVALTSGVATTVATLTLGAKTTAGGTIRCTIQVNDNTDVQSMTQYVEYAIVQKAGTYTSNITSTSGAKAVSAGTLTTVWTITAAGAIQLAATTSLTPSAAVANSFSVYLVIENNSETSVTLP